jgi:hypothetical protein
MALIVGRQTTRTPNIDITAVEEDSTERGSELLPCGPVPVGLLSLRVPIPRVISRFPDLGRCQLSHIVSSAFCLKLVSFLQALFLGSLGMLRSSVGAQGQLGRHCVT